MKRKPFTAEDIARYLIDSPSLMYEDGYYYAHYSEEKGLIYDGFASPNTIHAKCRCFYDTVDRDEFDAKESLDDADFMEICAILAHDLNKEIKSQEEDYISITEALEELDRQNG